MKFEYWVIGKSKEKFVLEGEEEYLKRLKKYTHLNYKTFPNIKVGKGESEVLKLKESQSFLAHIHSNDYIILLDENGKKYNSESFAQKIEKMKMSSSKRVIFITGGAYGFHSNLYHRANEKFSMSDMTFSHQMIRIFFLEQLYRAFTIINNEKYHNP